MIIGYIIEINKKIDDDWFKKEIRVDTIEEVQEFFINNPKSYKIGLRVLKKFDK